MTKKVLLCLLMGILSITLVGCGDSSGTDTLINNPLSSTKEITCTRESKDEDGYKTTDTMLITTKGKKKKKVTSTSVTETDPEYVDFTVSFGEAFAETFNKIEGMEMSYTKEGTNSVKMTLSVDYEKLDPTQIKDTLGELYDEDDSSLYNSKDLSFEEFEKESLEGYTCDN